MKILVINEPFVKDFCRTQRWAARTRGRVLRAPDWLAYATAVLEKHQYDVELYDFPAMNWGKDKLRELVQAKQPDVVVLDSTTPSIYSDIGCARVIKEAAGSKVVMVGPHATALPEETLLEAKGAVDVICRGEYDYTVLDVVQSFEKGKDLSSVLGISYMDRDGIKHNPDRPFIQNLDELPFPAWHHLDIMRYFDGGKLYPYVDMIAGRGCPYRCVFCLWPQVMHGHKYRLRSPNSVVDEMEYDLKRWPALKRGEIFFEDDTFTVNRKRAAAICDEIMRRGLKVTWSVNSRADVVDMELFKKMKRAGCRELLVGFESGDQGQLERMNKRLTIEQSKEFTKAAREAGLDIAACFVMGLPGETKETMERTIEFALSQDFTTIQFSAAVPFPGTAYYNFCRERGSLKAESWEDWLDAGEQSTVVEYPGLSKQDIVYYTDLGLKKFYFRPGYMVKFLLNTRSPSDLYRKLRGFKNFMSYLLNSRKSK
ncbi:MAG TPA: radical SAM protein [Dehalococcoidia bacterium]|nr:radical SAM protein [Dehalococcoidia bacterium]